MSRPGIGFVAQSDHVQQVIRPRDSLFAGSLFVGDGRLNQVFQHRQMREQIEVLKYVADVDPLAEDLFLFQFVQLVAFAAIADIVAIDLDKAFIDALQVVNRPQQRRFSRAGRPEDHRYRAGFDFQRHVIQRFMAAKVFADAGNGNMTVTRVGHGQAPAVVGGERVQRDGCCGRY